VLQYGQTSPTNEKSDKNYYFYFSVKNAKKQKKKKGREEILLAFMPQIQCTIFLELSETMIIENKIRFRSNKIGLVENHFM
jgi:hypothetical protein